MKGLGYSDSLDNLDFSIALLGMTAILASDYNNFQQRLIQIHHTLYPIITDATKEVIQESGYNKEQTIDRIVSQLSTDRKNVFYEDVQKNIKIKLQLIEAANKNYLINFQDFFRDLDLYNKNSESYLHHFIEKSKSVSQTQKKIISPHHATHSTERTK